MAKKIILPNGTETSFTEYKKEAIAYARRWERPEAEREFCLDLIQAIEAVYPDCFAANGGWSEASRIFHDCPLNCVQIGGN